MDSKSQNGVPIHFLWGKLVIHPITINCILFLSQNLGKNCVKPKLNMGNM